MMMTIKRKVEIIFIVKLNEWTSAAVVEAFRVGLAVPLVIFNCLQDQ